MKKLTFLMVVLMATTVIAFAQTPADTLAYPEVGKKMPDFTVRNIKYFKKTEASLADFKGKWLVLDFWNKGCGACFGAFPITNKIHEQMGDKVQVILVGIQDKEGQIYKIYDKFKERLHLTMPCAFDSNLAKRFDVYTAPHIVIVDPNGVVQSVTYAVNQEDMKGFVAGNPPNLPQTYYRMHDTRETQKISYNPGKPFLVENNGGADSDFICRSVLSRWNGAIHDIYAPSRIDEFGNGRFETLGMPLDYLYKFAYLGVYKWGPSDSFFYGKYYEKLILEVSDSFNFKSSYKYSKGLFSYSLILPNRFADKDDLEAAMQKDLMVYFGYDASVEKRICPCWRLIASDSAGNKLRTKGGQTFFEGLKDASFKANNYPFIKLVKRIQSYFFDYIQDDTGIKGNVDIEMDCIMTNQEDLNRALIKNGLQLVRSERPMMAIVVRSKKSKGGIALAH